MSKNKQRKISAEAEKKQMFRNGYSDGRLDKIFFWDRHPFLRQYEDGYLKGQDKRMELIK